MANKYILDHTGKPYAKIFEDISAIPRGSFKEQKIADFVCNFARNLGLEYIRDAADNVIIKKPATSGYEDHDTVMLQGHMDMIWAKRPGSNFDFEKNGIKLKISGEYLMAEETTCGSDDGVAVAYMLAILQDKTICHPALECVFTTAEEPGLYGVEKFDCSQLKARKYISMDGNKEGTSLIIATGAVNARIIHRFEREKMKEDSLCLKIIISGLTGAHIQFMERQLANAIKCMARILFYLRKEMHFSLIGIDGGNITTIPVECTAKIAIKADQMTEAKRTIERLFEEIQFEHKESDPDMSIIIEKIREETSVIPDNITENYIEFLHILPSGMVDMSLVFDKLPISSYSMEVIHTTENEINTFYRPQSAITSKMFDMSETIKLLAKKYNIEYKIENQFYGHCVNTGSPLYNIYDQVWFEQNGEHIYPIGAHYGNEIGFFLRKMPWLDMILLVATHYDAHTPDEKLDLASFDRCYKALVEILTRI